MTTIKQHINCLKKNGITVINNAISQKACDHYVGRCNRLFEKFLKRKRVHTFNRNCQWVQSPFRFDDSFFKLIHFKKANKILSKLLGQDYTITNSTIFNRRIYKHKLIHGYNMGDSWHTDSRYLDGKRLDKGFGFLVLLMFEDFTKDNGPTMYIPKSHILRTRPKKNVKYKHKLITGKRGTMYIIDTGIWHKGGSASNKSRWSLFNYYSPWFVKPYYQYEKMLGEKKSKKISKQIRKLLHYYSTPPINDETRLSTVTRI